MLPQRCKVAAPLVLVRISPTRYACASVKRSLILLLSHLLALGVGFAVGIYTLPRTFAGEKLHVVDLKLHRTVHWLSSGIIDHIPTTVFSAFPKLNRVYVAVRDYERVSTVPELSKGPIEYPGLSAGTATG